MAQQDLSRGRWEPKVDSTRSGPAISADLVWTLLSRERAASVLMAWTASLRRTSALRLDLHSRLWCRLDSSLAVSETPFRFQIAAAWHGKPPEPDEPARKRPRFAHQPGPTTESPLLRYREALLTSLEPRRIMGVRS